MSQTLDSHISPEERERRIWEASRQYARGDITVEKFEDAERNYAPDYEKAMFAISKSRKSDNQSAKF